MESSDINPVDGNILKSNRESKISQIGINQSD